MALNESLGQHAPWQVKSYLEYQGRKFLDRFDPVTYVKLTEQVSTLMLVVQSSIFFNGSHYSFLRYSTIDGFTRH